MAGRSTGVTVACVLHVPATGRCDYDAGYVDKLQRAVARHLPAPHRFVCLSNVEVPCERIPLTHPWGHWWAKMALFRPDLDLGRVLYFDLDTVIVGDIGELAEQRLLTLLADFNKPEWLQSGVMLLPEEARGRVWDAWIAGPERHMAEHAGNGDGGFLRSLGHAQTWQQVLPGRVVSFKRDIAKAHYVRKWDQPPSALPAGARVVCFHGRPRPAEMPAGYWLREAWAA